MVIVALAVHFQQLLRLERSGLASEVAVAAMRLVDVQMKLVDVQVLVVDGQVTVVDG